MQIDLPQHRLIYEHIRGQIESGMLLPGDLLPSENELARIHQVARPTVRKALDRLVVDNFIQKQQGKGSIVVGKPKGVGILSLKSTTSALGENLKTRIVVKPEMRPWKEAFGFQISDAERDAGCIYFERLRLVNQRPVFFDITMLPNINFPRFTMRNLEDASLFNILRTHYQVEIKGGEQRIFAIKADKKLVDFFDVKQGHPILQLDRKISTNRPGFHLYSQVFCNTQEYALYGTF
ncbi:MAG TPA: GntR family transcriptional regulator [Bacteroidales bacterium]|nr:GntR family transcriptional regulator [Bacteroidales bacterium]